MLVGNSAIDADFSALVDTGTSFTYFIEPIYSQLSKAVSLYNITFTTKWSISHTNKFLLCDFPSSMSRCRINNTQLIQRSHLNIVTLWGQFFHKVLSIDIEVLVRLTYDILASCSSGTSNVPTVTLTTSSGSPFPVNYPIIAFPVQV